MAQKISISYEKIEQIAQERAKKRKIQHILLDQIKNGNFISYPLDALDDAFKEEWKKEIIDYFYAVYESNHSQLKNIKELIGEEEYSKCCYKNFGGMREVPFSIITLKETMSTDKLEGDYQKGKIDKEKVLQTVEIETLKRNFIAPPISLNLSKEELDSFLIENYSQLYRVKFLEIEFEENPLLNARIENVLSYISPSFDSSDMISLSDNFDSKKMKRLIEQKKFLLEVVDQLYSTGKLDELFDYTTDKVCSLNELLSEENQIEVVKMNGDKIDYDKTYNLFKKRIEDLDLEKIDDRTELIMLSRHMLNKYTKDIDEYESNLINMYIEDWFLEQRNDRIIKRRRELNANIDKTLEEFFKGVEETLFNPEFINDEEALNKDNLSGIKKEIQEQYEDKWINTRNRNLSGYRINCILGVINRYKIKFVYDGEEIELKKDRKFDETLKQLVRNGVTRDEFAQVKEKLLKHIHYGDAFVEKIIQDKENINHELNLVRNAYEKLPRGQDNDNGYKNFSDFVVDYIEYLKNNSNLSGEEFFKNKLGVDNDYATELYNNFFDILNNKLRKIKFIPFKIKGYTAIGIMCKFLERKQKIYNLKSLNTVQLFRNGEKMSFSADQRQRAINVGIEGFAELFGTHYDVESPENRYVAQMQQSTEELNNSYLSKLGRVYIPFPRVTSGQKEEFKVLIGYIKQIESSTMQDDRNAYRDILSDDEKRKYDLLLGKYLEKQTAIQTIENSRLTRDENDAQKEKINSYNALKIQISLGAGLEYFRNEFMPEQEVEVAHEEPNETADENSNNEQNEELERLRREVSELRASNAAKDRTIEIQAQTIDKFKEKSSFMLEFIRTVKESKIGKIFFRKAIKQLPEGTSVETEEEREDR